MSEQENVCPVCKGFITTSDLSTHDWKRMPRICYGHPEPREKHDGKLDEQGKAEVWFTKGLSITPYVHISDRDEVVVLKARQALSLLDWLRQEESRLKELAEEDRE